MVTNIKDHPGDILAKIVDAKDWNDHKYWKWAGHLAPTVIGLILTKGAGAPEAAGAKGTVDFAAAADVGGSRGLTDVFRVEGPGNERLCIDACGNVSVTGTKTLHLNFGDLERAQSFLQQRLAKFPDDVIKSFKVPTSYVDSLRSMAVPKELAQQFPNLPIIVDVTKAADQFGLRAAQFEDLVKNIIPGSGIIF
jgi:hypothetical protein